MKVNHICILCVLHRCMSHLMPTECLLLCCKLYFDPSCRSECLNVNVEYLKNIFGSLYCIFEIIFAYLGESLLRLMSNHFLHSVYDKVSKSNHLYLTAWWLWLGECVILRHWIAALRMETSQHVWIITNCWVPPSPPLHVVPPPHCTWPRVTVTTIVPPMTWNISHLALEPRTIPGSLLRGALIRAWNECYSKVHEDFHNHREGPY